MAQQLHDVREMATFELQRLYDAHERMLEALPRMKKMASLPFLAECFQDEIADAEGHTERFNELFGQLGADIEAREDKAIRDIFADLDEIDPDASSPAVVDTKLIDVARKANLYLEASYGTLADIGEQMRLRKFAELNHDRLHEVDRAAEKLLNAVPDVVFV